MLRIFKRKTCPDMSRIDAVFKSESKRKAQLIKKIMEFDFDSVDFVAEEERAFPGNKSFIDSGYYKTMLKRYIFAGHDFCKQKRILDSCSGLGWGTYLLSHYAASVTAFDIEARTVEFCRKVWGSGKIDWLLGDALDLSFLLGKKFDVVCAMETIEHFSRTDGEKYISEISKLLNKKGFSYWDFCLSRNPYGSGEIMYHESLSSKYIHL